MHIQDILRDFDDVIIKRGKAYFQEGHVQDLTKISEDEYTATVEGTEDYSVNVSWDADGECSFDCDCPYSDAPYCKHVVAVLLAIEAGEAREEQNTKQESLEDMLENLSQRELLDLLYNLTAIFPATKRWLRARLSKPQNAIAEYRNLIRQTAKECSDHGYIEYGDMSAALGGVDSAVEHLRSMKDYPNIGEILDFCFMIFEETLSIMESGDDSDGYTGEYIGACFQFLDELLTQRVLSADVTEKTAYFERILQILNSSLFHSLDDDNDILVRQCINIADSLPCLRERILQYQMENANKTTNNYSDERKKRCAQGNCYDMLLRWQGKAAALEYAAKNPENDDFRIIFFEEYVQNRQYDEAIQLCLESERENASRAGLVRNWQMRRCDIYAKIGDVKNEKSLSETLLLNGNKEYYFSLKKLYTESEWTVKRDDLLNQMEKRMMYIFLEIILQENDKVRIMTYIRKNPHMVIRLYSYVLSDYPDEIREIFLSVLREDASNAGDRRMYHDVCRNIRTFYDVFADAALDFLHTLQLKYPRKSAFQDEIRKILPYCKK